MIDPSLDLVGIISATLDGDEFRVRFRLSDGRAAEVYWPTCDLRNLTPFHDGAALEPELRRLQ